MIRTTKRLCELSGIISEAYGNRPSGDRVKVIDVKDISHAKKLIAAAELLGLTPSLVGRDLEDKLGDIDFGENRLKIKGSKLYTDDYRPEEMILSKGSTLTLELYSNY